MERLQANQQAQLRKRRRRTTRPRMASALIKTKILVLGSAMALSGCFSTLGEVRLDPFNTGRFLPGYEGYTIICTNASDSSADIIGGSRQASTCGIDILIDSGQVTAYSPVGGSAGFS